MKRLHSLDHHSFVRRKVLLLISRQFIKNYYSRQFMRGIQINNYFNNHITLNGKKINQQPHAIAQHPKTKHLNPHLQETHPNVLEPKAPSLKSHELPPKKRTNTLLELKKHVPSKRSLSTDRQRNALSAKKKEQVTPNQSDKEEEPLINMSQRKLKPSSSKGGLGKRSKSTIIKTGQFDLPRTTAKKQTKKFSSNPTDQSVKPKAKRKKSSRIIQQSKQMKPTRPLTSRRQFIPIASKQAQKKQKQKLIIPLGKSEPRDEKKASMAGKSKAVLGKKKQSKPVSARQKKSKKNRFIEELKEKYENQTIMDGGLSHRVKGSDDIEDNQFISVMNNLEKVLSSVGSKEKLKHQLKLISQKLKEFKLNSESDRSEPFSENEEQHSNKKIEAYQEPREQKYQNGNQIRSESQEQNESQGSQLLKHKIEQDINPSQSKPEVDFLQNPLVGKRTHGFFFDEEPISMHFREEQQDRRKEIQALKKFKNQSTKMMEKAGLNLNPEPTEEQDSRIKLRMQEKEEKIQDRGYNLQRNEQQMSNSDCRKGSNSGVHGAEDRYPVGLPKSPKFDQLQLMGIISLKQQFLSDKHDKMSQLVKKMFEKQLVSPKSFQNQLRFLKKRYEDENTVLESMKKQAEQIMNQIKKDKEEIQGIDELIRNQKWDQAKKLVDNHHPKPSPQPDQPLQQETLQNGLKRSIDQKTEKYAKDQLGLGHWQREEGWERVEIRHSEVQNNEFVDIGQMSNRKRSKAYGKFQPVDIDQECGGTQQSIELEQECIYYNEDNNTEEKQEQAGLIKLVQIDQSDHNDQIEAIKPPTIASCNYNVFHIDADDKEKSIDASGSVAEKNQSNVSGVSSQNDRKGFTTNLYFIKEYCIALCEFVRDNQIFKSQFKVNISKPLVFNLQQMLRFLRSEDLSDYLYSKRETKAAITQLVWNQFNAQYQTLKFNSNQNKVSDRYKFEKQQELIFIRMIFDVLNQSLDSERPGSHFGKALPWHQNAKHLKNLKQANQPDKDNIQAYDLMFGVAIARIIQWGSCLCGFLPDTVELENTEIDEPYVQHIRETRMAFLLEKMMAAEQSVMTNFQMQETEVEYKLAQLIMDELLEEAASDVEAAFQQQ